KAGHYAQAVKLLQENLLTNPDDQMSRLLLAVAYEKAGEMQLAVARYREALARSPDNV
ncbi:MAG: tetratricopeptide repeat protein, partial [Anaerolineae bacterium]|nr:tetratricopeptide repeat protein [Anaerolineae bacterium]